MNTNKDQINRREELEINLNTAIAVARNDEGPKIGAVDGDLDGDTESLASGARDGLHVHPIAMGGANSVIGVHVFGLFVVAPIVLAKP